MPAYKTPKSSFAKALEWEMFSMSMDFALYINSIFGDHGKDGAVLDDLIYSYSFWEVQPQEVIDALVGIEKALCGRACPDCNFMMTSVEQAENKRRCQKCEDMPYDEWCKFVGLDPPSKDDEW